jgi:hypothetical protein
VACCPPTGAMDATRTLKRRVGPVGLEDAVNQRHGSWDLSVAFSSMVRLQISR